MLPIRTVIQDMPASKIREVANAAMHRDDVLAFWFGESDAAPPQAATDAMQASLARGETRYSHNLGFAPLREALATYTSNLHGKPVESGRIAVTSAGVSALMVAMQAIVSAGDRVVAVTPVWPNLIGIPTILGADVQQVALTVGAHGFELHMGRLLAALAPGTRALIINSPNNPTGWTLSRDEQQTILTHCRQHGIWLVADEVYENLYFRGAPAEAAPSFLDIADANDALLVINSFSKTWAMTGFRLGWLTAPAALMDDLAKLLEFNTSCAPLFAQHAGLAAVTESGNFAQDFAKSLYASREQIAARLQAMPRVALSRIDGAMYAFFKIEGMSDSLAMCKRLALEAGLGLAPGIAFSAEAEGYIRWCFASASDKLDAGLDRFERFMGNL